MTGLPRYLGPVRAGTLLILMLENRHAMRVSDLLARLRFMVPGIRKASLLDKRQGVISELCREGAIVRRRLGREVDVRLSPHVRGTWLAAEQHRIARFFGFHSWYGGIVKENNTPRRTYLRIRASYSKLRESRLRYYLRHHDGLSRSEAARMRPLTGFPRPDEGSGRGSKPGESPIKPSTNQEGEGARERAQTVPGV